MYNFYMVPTNKKLLTVKQFFYFQYKNIIEIYGRLIGVSNLCQEEK